MTFSAIVGFTFTNIVAAHAGDPAFYDNERINAVAPLKVAEPSVSTHPGRPGGESGERGGFNDYEEEGDFTITVVPAHIPIDDADGDDDSTDHRSAN